MGHTKSWQSNKMGKKENIYTDSKWHTYHKGVTKVHTLSSLLAVV